MPSSPVEPEWAKPGVRMDSKTFLGMPGLGEFVFGELAQFLRIL